MLITVTRERAVEPEDLDVEILVTSPLWEGHKDILVQALAAAAAEEKKRGEVSVLLGGDADVARLNKEFRGKDGPTNVLSFPGPRVEPAFLGDIALAAETIAAEAEFQGKRFEHHAAHLVVHGFLHLLGYDHENPAEADIMEGRERAILVSIGIEDPYA
jgi:probable rRNA maturation factor